MRRCSYLGGCGADPAILEPGLAPDRLTPGHPQRILLQLQSSIDYFYYFFYGALRYW